MSRTVGIGDSETLSVFDDVRVIRFTVSIGLTALNSVSLYMLHISSKTSTRQERLNKKEAVVSVVFSTMYIRLCPSQNALYPSCAHDFVLPRMRSNLIKQQTKKNRSDTSEFTTVISRHSLQIRHHQLLVSIGTGLCPCQKKRMRLSCLIRI
jgi:hypothetical protein